MEFVPARDPDMTWPRQRKHSLRRQGLIAPGWILVTILALGCGGGFVAHVVANTIAEPRTGLGMTLVRDRSLSTMGSAEAAEPMPEEWKAQLLDDVIKSARQEMQRRKAN